MAHLQDSLHHEARQSHSKHHTLNRDTLHQGTHHHTLNHDTPHHQQHAEHEEHVPAWLQWILAVLIVLNILSYFVVTWFTMKSLNDQIAQLEIKQSSFKPESTTEWMQLGVDLRRSPRQANGTHRKSYRKGMLLAETAKDPESLEIEKHELEHRKHQILLGTVMEMFLDTVDLVNTFVHNFWVHAVYTIIKLGSIGMWTYAQADLDMPALWFIPIGIAMLITLLLVEWHESARKYILALLIIVASVSWVFMLVILCGHLKADIAAWTEKSNDPRENKTDCELHIYKLHSDMTQDIAGTTVMVVLGAYGLVAICIASFWVGVIFFVLYLAGDLWWIYLVTTDDNVQNRLFEVPLVYVTLIHAVSILYLYELHYTKIRRNHGSSSFLKKVNSQAPKLSSRGALPKTVNTSALRLKEKTKQGKTIK